MGGFRTFAASARHCANLVEAAVHLAVELKNAAPDLMAAVSPSRRIKGAPKHDAPKLLRLA